MTPMDLFKRYLEPQKQQGFPIMYIPNIQGSLSEVGRVRCESKKISTLLPNNL